MRQAFVELVLRCGIWFWLQFLCWTSPRVRLASQSRPARVRVLGREACEHLAASLAFELWRRQVGQDAPSWHQASPALLRVVRLADAEPRAILSQLSVAETAAIEPFLHWRAFRVFVLMSRDLLRWFDTARPPSEVAALLWLAQDEGVVLAVRTLALRQLNLAVSSAA